MSKKQKVKNPYVDQIVRKNLDKKVGKNDRSV